jgi:hypothetical protein
VPEGQSRAIRELEAIRAAVAALPAPVEVDDFAPECLLEISTAVERFNRPVDSIRWMCRSRLAA